MADLIFITHPEVIIDPNVPVPDWGLSDLGAARMTQFAVAGLASKVTRIISSTECKAREAAAILAATCPKAVREEDPQMGENDRSATGFLPPAEFETMADAFFANPETSIRGWERAADAQARILAALDRAVAQHGAGDLAIVAHGAVGALALCHLKGVPISRTHDQPGAGCFWRARLPDLQLEHGWRPIA